MFRLNSKAYKDRRQEREYIRLEKCNEKLQERHQNYPENNSDTNRPGLEDKDKSQEARYHDMTGEHIGK
jgi:hypothetical protein